MKLVRATLTRRAQEVRTSDITTKLILPENCPVTSLSRTTTLTPTKFQPGDQWFCLFQVLAIGKETVMNYQLIRLEFVSVIVR